MALSRASSTDLSPSVTPSGTPVSQVPKFGTPVPNRIFVGALPPTANSQELKQFFSNYGVVKDCKIITDRAGISRGYGFVTFEAQEDAERILREQTSTKRLLFKDKEINVARAVRKQQIYPRFGDVPQLPHILLAANGCMPYGYQQNAVFQTPEGYALQIQAQGLPLMVHQNSPVYLTQPGVAYQTPSATPVTPPATQWSNNAWRWAHQTPVNQPMTGGQVYYSIPMQELIYATPNQSAYVQEGGDGTLIEGLPVDMNMKHASAAVQPCFMGM